MLDEAEDKWQNGMKILQNLIGRQNLKMHNNY